MSINKQNDVDCFVEITNFFAGGDEKRKEILAQPECNCPSCPVNCDCRGGIEYNATNLGNARVNRNSSSL